MTGLLLHRFSMFPGVLNVILRRSRHVRVNLYKYTVPWYHVELPYSTMNMIPAESRLERTITKNLKSRRVSDVFEQLCEASDSSLCNLNKRTWGSVFYCLNENGEYDKLDIISKRAEGLGINCGEGAYTTLIRCYIQRREVTKAYDLLCVMKKRGLVRHSRTYFPVITGLAGTGHTTEAFELFKEMQQHVFKSNKTVSLAIPHSMSVSLIKSCIITKQDTRKAEPNKDYDKTKYILQYYNQSGRLLTPDIVETIVEWLSCDPVNEWLVNECQISGKGLCSSCHQYLDNGTTFSNCDMLQKHILNTVETIFEKEPNKQWMHFKNYQEFLQRHGPHEIIIDGMNVGLSVGPKKQQRHFNERILCQVVEHFLNQNQKILVLVNTSVSPLKCLESHQVYATDARYDDLYIIYACAFSSLIPYIVTKDKLREHRFLLDFDTYKQYLQWIRLHTINVELYNDILSFKTKHFDHVVQQGNTGWHLPVNNGKWFCAQRE